MHGKVADIRGVIEGYIVPDNRGNNELYTKIFLRIFGNRKSEVQRKSMHGSWQNRLIIHGKKELLIIGGQMVPDSRGKKWGVITKVFPAPK